MQGASCWQGGMRSLKVSLQCGQRTELLSVEEPEMCTYVAAMSSPAVCDEAGAAAVQREIDVLLGKGEAAGHSSPPPQHEDL